MRFIPTRHLVAVLAVSAALGGGALAADAHAAPAPNATAQSDTPLGMVVNGGDGPNRLTIVTAPGDRFLVSDTAPITAGPGCQPATAGGGLFAVSCVAPRHPNGQFLPFRVKAGGGDDVVNNSSTAGMRAQGDLGNDVLNGGILGDLLSDATGTDSLRGNGGDDSLTTTLSQAGAGDDVLDGGAGNDDLQAGASNDRLLGGPGDDTMRGGAGADEFDGGVGAHDTVVYLDNAHQQYPRLVASIDNTANDGIAPLSGPATEKDNVRDTVEDLFGAHGDDTLFGSKGPNEIDGNLGNDTIIGNDGADLLKGNNGDDRLASNDLLGVAQPDGDFDVLNGGDGTDFCKIPFPSQEADATASCEITQHD
jgi:Ca2+-binding RTX toxin-like protein